MFELKKIETHLQQLPQKNKPPIIDQTPSGFSTIVQPLPINLTKKIRPASNLKREEPQKTKHSIVPRVFLYILVCYRGSEGHPLRLGLMQEKFLEITTTRLVKMNFPAWQLFLKTQPQKCWPQYLGNYTDNTDVTYTHLGNYTDGTK